MESEQRKKVIELALTSKDFGKEEKVVKDLNYYKDFVAQKNGATNWKNFITRTNETAKEHNIDSFKIIERQLDVVAEMYAINQVIENLHLHPKVQAFAKTMHDELKANEPKKGTEWEEWGDIAKMIEELHYHEEKLFDALKNGDKARIKEYLADCGNFLLFIGNANFLYE